jgi:hypothetical protein
MRNEETHERVSDDATLNSIEDILDDDSLSPTEKVAEIEEAFYGENDESDYESD